ncbi:hypothetical protein MYA_5212 [Burkholderia sp. KJ006]|nr:hypothetical protein MYA_5212 [Burkholderia sp. KJ006]
MPVGKAWPGGGEITQSIQEMAHGDLVFPVFWQTQIVERGGMPAAKRCI